MSAEHGGGDHGSSGGGGAGADFINKAFGTFMDTEVQKEVLDSSIFFGLDKKKGTDKLKDHAKPGDKKKKADSGQSPAKP